MAMHTVEFQFITGLKRDVFRNARLRGSWDNAGRYSDDWTESPMQARIGEDGCPIFAASIRLDLADSDKTFKWGVVLDGPQGNNFWGIPTEVQDVHSAERYRQFRLGRGTAAPQVERYYFTYCRRLGANKHFSGASATPGLRFAVWAPNASSVDVVFGKPTAATLPMTVPGLIRRSPWSRFPAWLKASGKENRPAILKRSKVAPTCIAS